ncbi:MAG: chorismate synthase [Parachlamydiales bacterium]
MASNTFGTHFQITTWGESHGKAIGVVIDGCPAALPLTAEEIDAELALRAPGKSPYTSPRSEPDRVQILSGLFEGETTGAPISLLIENRDAKPSAYDPIRHLIRPGHAGKSYQQKYGLQDHRGGGRASARETACRVAAGAVAKKLLAAHGIEVIAYLRECGGIEMGEILLPTRSQILSSPLFCPDPKAEQKMRLRLEEARKEGDSLGGVVEMVALGNTAGLGDPVYQKLEALLAYAMMSLPASRGVEVGAGFSSARMKGSEHNPLPEGILGGIATGEPVICRVAFKPTSSIAKPQKTIDSEGNPATLTLPPGSRHDPCVAIRATRVVEAMGNLVLADRLLANRLSQMVPCS